MVKLTQEILRKIIQAGVIVGLLSGAASAQMPMPGISLDPGPRPLTPEEKEKQKAIENAYKSAIGKIPDQKKPVDAWGGIRQNPPPSSRSKQGQQ
jgi:hypothetical protein